MSGKNSWEGIIDRQIDPSRRAGREVPASRSFPCVPRSFAGHRLPAGDLLVFGSPTQKRAHSAGTESTMAKAYWVASYRSISNPDALAAYAKLAGPAIAAAGGRFLARGTAAKAYEAGIAQRIVIIEFDSVEHAVKAHDGEAYQAALKVFANAAERDLRIVEGLA
jgi:uncharacterized protein (DUF1330 family)